MPSVPSVMDPALPATSSLLLGIPFGAHSERRLPVALVRCALADLLHGARGPSDWPGLDMRRGLECEIHDLFEQNLRPCVV